METNDRTNTTQVAALKGMDTVVIACGCWHSAALTRDGAVYTWGRPVPKPCAEAGVALHRVVAAVAEASPSTVPAVLVVAVEEASPCTVLAVLWWRFGAAAATKFQPARAGLQAFEPSPP